MQNIFMTLVKIAFVTVCVLGCLVVWSVVSSVYNYITTPDHGYLTPEQLETLSDDWRHPTVEKEFEELKPLTEEEFKALQDYLRNKHNNPNENQ